MKNSTKSNGATPVQIKATTVNPTSGIDEILDLVDEMAAENHVSTVVTKVVAKQDKPKADKKVAEAKPIIIATNIDDLMKAITPEAVMTPKHFDLYFKINDGGKTVRRHLRKHFGLELAHEFNNKWMFEKAQPTTAKIVSYFAGLYATK